MATEATTVDGVEPSVLVKYVQNVSLSDPSEGITLAPFDDGGPRSIELGGDAVLVTPDELSKISSIVPSEVVEDSTPAPVSTPTPSAPATQPTISSISPSTPAS